MKPTKPIKLDKYEQSIENNIQNFVPVSKKERAKIEAIIDGTRKTKNINIRISNYDIDRIRIMSAAEGLPYQMFIGSILHKYVSGRLIDEKAILQYIKAIHSNDTPEPIKKPKSKQPA
jgi:predicted DNA binding CopG/RHH family protein